MASDPGRHVPNDPFGTALIPSHSPVSVAGSHEGASVHHASEKSDARPDSYQQSGISSSTEDLRLRDQPSVELLGSELYEIYKP